MPRTTKTPSIQSQSREPDSKAFIKNLTGRPGEVDPIQEEDEICEEYQRLDEEIRVLVARQKELKCDVEQRLIVQDEEGEDSYIESSDGTMKFTLVKKPIHKGSKMYEAMLEAHKKETKDLKATLDKEIRHGEATLLRIETHVRFTGPKIK